MKPLVLVTAPVQTRSGYGNHSRDIVRALLDLDKYEVKVNSVRWGNTPMNALEDGNPIHDRIKECILPQPSLPRQPELHMHVVVPNEFQQLGKKNIGFTAGIETTVPPPQWVEGANRMDLNIFTSEFSKLGFTSAEFESQNQQGQKGPLLKLSKPAEVLFEGVDTDVYKVTKEFDDEIKETFNSIDSNWNYLFTGHWLAGNMGEDRKDIGMMVKTFCESFKNQKNQPALILKTSGATPSILDRQEVLSKIDEIKRQIVGDLPNIYVLHGDLRDEEMNQLYNHPKVKAHVTFTHGEGFGRPLLEATLSEKPVIASNWSGQVDFLNQDSVLLPGNLIDVPKNSFPKEFLVDGAKWFQVNYAYASNVLKEVHKNYVKYVTKAKKQSIVNKSKFSLDQMTKALDGILSKHLPKFEEQPKKVDIKLPTLKKVSKPKKVELPKLKKVN